MEEESVVRDFSDFKNLKPSPAPLPKGIEIYEFTTEGEFIKKWNSVKRAADAFGTSCSHVRRCLSGKCLTVKGRIFLTDRKLLKERLRLIREVEEKEAIRKAAELEFQKLREIRVYTSSGEYLRTCSCLREVCNLYGVSVSTVSNHLADRSCVTDGLIFLNSDQTLEERLKKIKKRKTWKKNI